MDRLRAIAANYRTALVLVLLAVFLHVHWYTVDKATGREVVSGFGASLVVLCMWVAGFPLIRRGLQRVGHTGPDYIDGVLPQFRPMARRMEAAQERHRVRRDQIDERVVGVRLALVGTLLNGYGAPLARLVGWGG